MSYASRNYHPVMQGVIMGGAIAALDLILRPNFTGGTIVEILLFLLEGIAADWVFEWTSNRNNGATSGSGCSMSFGIDWMDSIVAGLVIWMSDIFLRPYFVQGLAMQLSKFFIQGLLVVFSLMLMA